MVHKMTEYRWYKLPDGREVYRKPPRLNTKRSGLGAPLLIRDDMDPVQSQLDGKMYDSKSALRATYKAAGVVEVGNDSSAFEPQAMPKSGPDRSEVKATVAKAFSRAGLGA